MSLAGPIAIFIVALLLPPVLLEFWAIRLSRRAQGGWVRVLKLVVPVVVAASFVVIATNVLKGISEVRRFASGDRVTVLAAGISEGANTWAFWWLAATVLLGLTLTAVSLTRLRRP
jgi:hypothetical protein